MEMTMSSRYPSAKQRVIADIKANLEHPRVVPGTIDSSLSLEEIAANNAFVEEVRRLIGLYFIQLSSANWPDGHVYLMSGTLGEQTGVTFAMSYAYHSEEDSFYWASNIDSTGMNHVEWMLTDNKKLYTKLHAGHYVYPVTSEALSLITDEQRRATLDCLSSLLDPD